MTRWLSIGDAGPKPDWVGFPTLPLDDVFRFRGRCVDTLDAAQMVEVDAAISVGVSHAQDLLLGDPIDVGATEVASPGLAADVPIWPAFAMLRGAQLGALATGWLLTFDTEAWLQARRAIPSIPRGALAQLRATMDPYDAALLVVYVSTGSPPASLAAMKLEDVEGEARAVHMQGHVFDVAGDIRSPLKAHVNYIAGNERTGPLFPRPNGQHHSPTSMDRRLQKVLGHFGLAQTIDAVDRITRRPAAIPDIASYMGLDMVKLGVA